jgi:hypothetical protein
MPANSIRPCLLGLVTALAFMSDAAIADVPGVAAGIPEAERRNVIVQVYNWKFNFRVKERILSLPARGQRPLQRLQSERVVGPARQDRLHDVGCKQCQRRVRPT